MKDSIKRAKQKKQPYDTGTELKLLNLNAKFKTGLLPENETVFTEENIE